MSIMKMFTMLRSYLVVTKITSVCPLNQFEDALVCKKLSVWKISLQYLGFTLSYFIFRFLTAWLFFVFLLEPFFVYMCLENYKDKI